MPKDMTNDMFGDPTAHICAVCKARKATCWFTGGNMMSAIHGDLQPRCDPCVVREQLEAARKAAAKIPELEAELARLEAEPEK